MSEREEKPFRRDSQKKSFGSTGPLRPNSASRPNVRDEGNRRSVAPSIKPYLSLRTERGRLDSCQFLLEGFKSIAEAVEVSPAIIRQVFIANSIQQVDFLDLLSKKRIPVERVSGASIDALSSTETPQGAIAVADFASLKPDWARIRYVTMLDAIQDPGNVGAVFRTSIALGMDSLILGKGTCDAYNPKVVRAATGALLRIPFEANVDIISRLDYLRHQGFSIVGTSSHAHTSLEQVKLRRKVALVIGNEGMGTDSRLLALCDSVVHIPMHNKVESLNVAVAHGILCHQLISSRKE